MKLFIGLNISCISSRTMYDVDRGKKRMLQMRVIPTAIPSGMISTRGMVPTKLGIPGALVKNMSDTIIAKTCVSASFGAAIRSRALRVGQLMLRDK